MKAIWKDEVIAQSDDTITVEENHYFPADSVKDGVLVASEHASVCPWKGKASYYHVEVGGERNTDAAWFYPEASDAAKQIEGRIAFWKGVEVVDG